MKLVYFAWMKEKLGIAEETVDPPAGIVDVGGLVDWLRERNDVYAEVFADTAAVRAAVNYEFAKADYPVSPDDEVAFFPPVTGG